MSEALRRRFRLWFALDQPVDRRTYFRNGVGLMALKYVVDATVLTLAAGRFWTPLDYLNPVWSMREAKLAGAPGWVMAATVIWTLPFLWIGVSMSLRRAVDAGRSAWLCLLFFVPVANYLFMLLLSVLPSAAGAAWRPRAAAVAPPADERLRSALVGIAAGLAVTIPTVLLSVLVARSYSTSLFLGIPFSLGTVSAFFFNRPEPRTLRATVQVALLSVLLLGGAMVLFALEGLLCVAMALPLAGALALLGAILGRTIALYSSASGWPAAGVMVLLPVLTAVDAVPAPTPLHEVVTAVEIAAPAARVWRNVVTFSELPEPTEWLFRTGVAYPRRAHLEGAGAGAVRYCEFSTGTFVEPITRWEEPRQLTFDVAEQPIPMREWSPYSRVHAAHLYGYFRAKRGEFRLIGLPGGRTRLEGSTWYELRIYPGWYWKPYADAIVERIHRRVLLHIKRSTEAR